MHNFTNSYYTEVFLWFVHTFSVCYIFWFVFCVQLFLNLYIILYFYSIQFQTICCAFLYEKNNNLSAETTAKLTLSPSGPGRPKMPGIPMKP